MSRNTEIYLPFVVATIVSAIVAFIVFTFGISTPISKSIPVSMLIFATFLSGFSIMHRIMLFCIPDSDVLKFAVNTGYYQDILAYIKHPIYLSISLYIVSLIGLLLETDAIVIWLVWFVILTFFVTLSLGLLVRNEMLMFRIFERFLEESVR